MKLHKTGTGKLNCIDAQGMLKYRFHKNFSVHVSSIALRVPYFLILCFQFMEMRT